MSSVHRTVLHAGAACWKVRPGTSSVPSKVAAVVCQCGIMPVPASVGKSLTHQTVWFLPLAQSRRARVEKKKQVGKEQ